VTFTWPGCCRPSMTIPRPGLRRGCRHPAQELRPKTLPPIRVNIKLAEAPSFKRTIFEHAADSTAPATTFGSSNGCGQHKVGTSGGAIAEPSSKDAPTTHRTPGVTMPGGAISEPSSRCANQSSHARRDEGPPDEWQGREVEGWMCRGNALREIRKTAEPSTIGTRPALGDNPLDGEDLLVDAVFGGLAHAGPRSEWARIPSRSTTRSSRSPSITRISSGSINMVARAQAPWRLQGEQE